MGKRRGRPPLGVDHVDSLPGDPAEKERLKVILKAITAEIPVKEACRRLAVSESRFHELRQQALLGMLEGLAPRPSGRPPREREPQEVVELRARNRFLEEELEVSRLQTEIAAWKPSLLREVLSSCEKGGSSSGRNSRRGWSGKPGAEANTGNE
jgi:transposase-like protein